MKARISSSKAALKSIAALGILGALLAVDIGRRWEASAQNVGLIIEGKIVRRAENSKVAETMGNRIVVRARFDIDDIKIESVSAGGGKNSEVFVTGQFLGNASYVIFDSHKSFNIKVDNPEFAINDVQVEGQDQLVFRGDHESGYFLTEFYGNASAISSFIRPFHPSRERFRGASISFATKSIKGRLFEADIDRVTDWKEHEITILMWFEIGILGILWGVVLWMTLRKPATSNSVLPGKAEQASGGVRDEL